MEKKQALEKLKRISEALDLSAEDVVEYFSPKDNKLAASASIFRRYFKFGPRSKKK